MAARKRKATKLRRSQRKTQASQKPVPDIIRQLAAEARSPVTQQPPDELRDLFALWTLALDKERVLQKRLAELRNARDQLEEPPPYRYASSRWDNDADEWISRLASHCVAIEVYARRKAESFGAIQQCRARIQHFHEALMPLTQRPGPLRKLWKSEFAVDPQQSPHDPSTQLKLLRARKEDYEAELAAEHNPRRVWREQQDRKRTRQLQEALTTARDSVAECLRVERDTRQELASPRWYSQDHRDAAQQALGDVAVAYSALHGTDAPEDPSRRFRRLLRSPSVQDVLKAGRPDGTQGPRKAADELVAKLLGRLCLETVIPAQSGNPESSRFAAFPESRHGT